MGYQQWVVIKINNSSAKTVVVKNVNLTWGKFYPDNNQDAEIPTGDIENTNINSKGEFTISSCGRKDSPSGTEGNFDIYEDGGGKVGHFYWNCPWGIATNSWIISEDNEEWSVGSAGANLERGPLGDITVRLYKD